MHGHTKKDEEKKTDEDRVVMAKKAAKYGAMSSMLLGRRAAGQGDDESFEMTGKALRMNPDFYSLWNFRRDMLIIRHGPTIGLANDRVPSASDGEGVGTGGREGGGKASPFCKISASSGAEVVASEFRLTTDAILKNPKCYGAWHHRQWVAERFNYDTAAELELCRDFLKADQRNFHCWIYRSFVVHDAAESGAGAIADLIAAERAFSTEKLHENFSNYSAFHYRSVYIGRWREGEEDVSAVQAVVEEELLLVESAIFTEPDDQSAWWYLRFLLSLVEDTAASGAAGAGPDALSEWQRQVLALQVESLQSLLEEEEGCKWCMLALVDVLGRQHRDHALTEQHSDGQGGRSGSGEEAGETRVRVEELRLALLGDLIRVDPAHTQRYLYLQRSQ